MLQIRIDDQRSTEKDDQAPNSKLRGSRRVVRDSKIEQDVSKMSAMGDRAHEGNSHQRVVVPCLYGRPS